MQALHHFELTKVASAPAGMAGDLITYTLTITHEQEVSPTTNVVQTDTIPLGTNFVSDSTPYTQIGNIIMWSRPSMDPMQALHVDLAVQVDITATRSIVNVDYVVRSDQVNAVWDAPVTTRLGRLIFLAMVISSP